MSLRAMVWVLEHSEARLGDRLVLLALADHADDDGRDAYPSVATIAAKARISERQVQRCLRSLCDAGRISEQGVSRFGTTIYDLDLSVPDSGGDNLSGVTSETEIVSEMSPEPSFEPSSVCVEPSESLTLTAEPLPIPRAREQKLGRVDRKLATPAEEEQAAKVLGYWNIVAKQDLTSRDWLAKIVMRIREHPDVTDDEHYRIIHSVLHDPEPWWSHPPSPSIVYGNGAQFERCLTRVRCHAPALSNGNGKRRYGYGVTSSELGEWAAQLRSEGR